MNLSLVKIGSYVKRSESYSCGCSNFKVIEVYYDYCVLIGIETNCRSKNKCHLYSYNIRTGNLEAFFKIVNPLTITI